MFIVNGCPKSGTHAICALLDTMGLKRVPGTILPLGDGLYVTGVPVMSVAALKSIPDNCYILAHAPASHGLEGFRVITIFRDPRNVLVSYCRHRKREDDLDVTIEEAIASFWDAPFVQTYSSYLGWAGRAVVIRYEDLPSAAIGCGEGIYRGHDKDWNTRTGEPSDWREVWTEEGEAAWIAHGGPRLLAEAGYD